MINGTYRVSFDVVLTDCQDEEDAKNAVGDMVESMIDVREFPEVNFELIEEEDVEYNTEEDELEELDFEEAV